MWSGPVGLGAIRTRVATRLVCVVVEQSARGPVWTAAVPVAPFPPKEPRMSGRVRSRAAHRLRGRGVFRAFVGASTVPLLALPASTVAAEPAQRPASDSIAPPSAAKAGQEPASSGFASLRVIAPSGTVDVGRIPGEPIYAAPG